MGFLNLVKLFILIAVSANQIKGDLVIDDYASNSFFITYAGTGAHTAPATLSTTSGSLSPFNSGAIICTNNEFKYCTMSIPELDFNTNTGETVSATDFANAVSTAVFYPVKTTIETYGISVSTTANNWEGSYAFQTNPIRFGENLPVSFNYGIQGGSMSSGYLSFANGENQIFGSNPTVTATSTISFSTPTKVTIRSNNDGTTCGIIIEDTSGANPIGCINPSNVQETTFSSTQGFGGFYQVLDSNNPTSFILAVVTYSIYTPRIMSWHSTTPDSVDLNIQTYYSSLSDFEMTYSHVTDWNWDWSLTYSSAESPIAITSSMTLNGLLSCARVYTNITASQSATKAIIPFDVDYLVAPRGFETLSTQSVGAMSGFGTIVDSGALLYGLNYGSLSSTNFDCNQNVIPMVVALSSGGTGLFVDGSWYGTDPGTMPDGSGGAAETVLLNPITTVEVEFDTSNNNAIVAITFRPLDTSASSQTIRSSTPGGGSTSIQSITSSGAVMIGINANFNAILGNILVGIEVDFGAPNMPLLFKTRDIADYPGAFSTSTFSADYDGDLQQLGWLNPVSYVSMYASITGFFLADDEVYNMAGHHYSEMGSVHMLAVYQLVAGRNYTIDVYGDFRGINSISTGDVIFDTSNGVQVSCTTAGLYSEQIEWEAVPQVSILHSETSIYPTSVTSQTSPSSSDNQNIYGDSTVYFQYIAAVDYPQFPTFAGFPTNVGVYWISGENTIRGIWLDYSDGIGGTLTSYVAGSSADKASQNTNEETFSIASSRVEGLGISFTNNQLSGLQFTLGGSSRTSCLSPNGFNGCTQSTSSSQSTADGDTYYLYDLSVTTVSGGNYVSSIKGLLTSLNIPVLMTNSRTVPCIMTANIDYSFVRNSYWGFVHDLSNDIAICGTTYQFLSVPGTPSLHDAQTRTFVNHEAVYHQLVTRQSDDPTGNSDLTGQGVTITRSNVWEVSSFCYYDAKGLPSAFYSTKEDSPMLVVGENDLNFQIDLYKQTTTLFTETYQSSTPTIIMNTPVYMGISLVSGSLSSLVVVATDCWATEDSNPDNGNYWMIESNTCPVDPTFYRTNSAPQAEDQIQFDAFSWTNNLGGQIYIHCDVVACPTENQTYCTLQSCGTDRSKRAAVDGPVHKRISRPNPIFVSSPHTSNILKIDRENFRSDVSSFAGFISMFATVMVCCVVVIGYQVVKSRRRMAKYNNLVNQ